MTDQLQSRKAWLTSEIKELKEWLFNNTEHPDRIYKFRLKLQYEQELGGGTSFGQKFFNHEN